MNIVNVIRYIAHNNGIDEVDFWNDVLVCNDGNGQYIKNWNLGFEQPTIEEMHKVSDLADKYCESMLYINDRKKEYPSIEEQLDMLYWDQVNGTNNWRTLIREIKDKYPKPEEL